MVGAGLVAVVMTLVFASRAGAPATSYTTFVLIISLLSFSRGAAYAPWMAAFTETVEARNPALVATGLAVWGWLLRVVVAVSFLVLPVVIDSVTPVTEYGPHLQAIAAAYPAQVATLRALDPATRAGLRATPPARPAVARALEEIEAADHVGTGAAAGRLLALRAVPGADRAYLSAHSQAVAAAKAEAPGQWRTWWWVCAAGQVAFLPTVFLLRGRWRRSQALKDRAEHDRRIAAEMAMLAPAGAGARVDMAADLLSP